MHDGHGNHGHAHELPDDRRRAVTSVVSGQLLAAFFEELLLGPSPVDRVAIRGEATAAAVFPT